MYIYKITVLPINQSYIGLDTKPSYKMARWKDHVRKHTAGKTKLHRAMALYGIDQCEVEILEDHIPTIVQLALREIALIDLFATFRNGLNSSPGGDGLGKHDLHRLSEDDILAIKATLGSRMADYNRSIKWIDTTSEERRVLTSHLHTLEVYQKKANTLKRYYEANPSARTHKGITIAKWRANNPQLLSAMNKKAADLAAQVNRQRLRVETEDGQVREYDSLKEFREATGMWPGYILKKTKDGLYHKGYKAWRI